MLQNKPANSNKKTPPSGSIFILGPMTTTILAQLAADRGLDGPEALIREVIMKYVNLHWYCTTERRAEAA